MSRNGSGTYNLPSNSWNPAVNGVPATASDWQTLINDVASAMTQSVSKDGQTPLTGNLSAGGNKVTGLAAAVANGDAVRFEQIADFVSRTLATGSAILPAGTTAQRDGTPVAGYLRYNSETTSFEGYSGGVWGSIGGGATGAGGDEVFYENDTVVTTSYTIAKNAHTVGPLTINSGVTLTINSGKRLVVL